MMIYIKKQQQTDVMLIYVTFETNRRSTYEQN